MLKQIQKKRIISQSWWIVWLFFRVFFCRENWAASNMSLKKKPKEDDHEALAGEDVATGDWHNIITSYYFFVFLFKIVFWECLPSVKSWLNILVRLKLFLKTSENPGKFLIFVYHLQTQMYALKYTTFLFYFCVRLLMIVFKINFR